MNTLQAIEYEKQILDSAKGWVNGEASIDNEIELLTIAIHYGVKLPACMHHFRYSNNPNEVCLTGAAKTIYKTMAKLAQAICATENIECRYRLV